ncbi:transposase [Gluconobacter cadivus]|uniref:transposase n=1 Tax=Gluconobacter TaxID=441 RepID=UPI0038D108F6
MYTIGLRSDSLVASTKAIRWSGDLTDREWAITGPLLPPERGRWARPAGDNRLFLNGMLHVLRTGCPWRDMHKRYGK